MRPPHLPDGGKTLLIVGLGQIGGRLAQLAKAFDMRVIGIRRDPRAGAGHADAVHAMSALKALLPQADFVALTCPLTAETDLAGYMIGFAATAAFAQEHARPAGEGNRPEPARQEQNAPGVLSLLPGDAVTEHSIDTAGASLPIPRPPARFRCSISRGSARQRSPTQPMSRNRTTSGGR